VAAPVFGASGTLITGTAGTASFPVPASVAAGDFIVVVFFLDGANTVTAYPSGFAEAENSPVTLPAGGGTHSLHVVWKWATGADTGTYDFTFASSGYREGAAHRYTGAAGSGTPFDSPTGSASDTANATTTPPVSTTTLGADRLLLFAGTDWAGGSWTPPTGYAERMDSGVGLVTLDDLAQAAAGSSGSVSATSTGSNKRTAWIGGLIPAGAAAATATAQPLVVTAAGIAARPTVIVLRTPPAPVSAPRPLVVTAPQPATGQTAILSRGSLVDAPVLTTASPYVAARPAPPSTAVQPTVLRSSLADVVVVASATGSPYVVAAPARPAAVSPPVLLRTAPADQPSPRPTVVTAPTAVPASTPLVLRSTLVDPPVLTTASPTVVTTPSPLPAAAVIVSRAPQAAAAVVPAATPSPQVVTATPAVRLATPILLRGVGAPGAAIFSAPRPRIRTTAGGRRLRTTAGDNTLRTTTRGG